MIPVRLSSFRPFPWLILIATAAFALVPWWTDNVTWRENLILAALDITLASNLNLMLGYAGYVNFGNIVMSSAARMRFSREVTLSVHHGTNATARVTIKISHGNGRNELNRTEITFLKTRKCRAGTR